MHYKGFTITVENYIYRVVVVRNKTFATFGDACKEVDRIEADFQAIIHQINS
jgi:hypothetical protein